MLSQFHRVSSFNYGADTDSHRLMLKQWWYLNRQNLLSDSFNRMMSLTGSGLKTEVKHLSNKIVAALLISNPCTLFINLEMCNLKINILKVHPIGMANLKNNNNNSQCSVAQWLA